MGREAHAAAGRWKKKGGSSKLNPFSVRGLEKLSQITSELKAKRQEIAAKIGASPSRVWLTTAASSGDLVAIIPSSFATNVTAPLLIANSSSSHDPQLRRGGNNGHEPCHRSSVDPTPAKARKPSHNFFIFLLLFVSACIRKTLELLLRRGQSKAVNTCMHAGPSGLAEHPSPPPACSSAGRGQGDQQADSTTAACSRSPAGPETISDYETPNLTSPLRKILSALPQRSAGATSSPVLLTLRALQARSVSMPAGAAKVRQPQRTVPDSDAENSEVVMRKMRLYSRTAKFPAREGKSYGAMVMLVIALGSLVLGIVPGVLATAFAWFVLPQLKGFVRNKDLKMNGAVAMKREQQSLQIPNANSKARKSVDQSTSTRKRRCM